ncbi:unnamed protein product [Cylicocyclus nassatus]|uniref:Uncharacterized protein n=1 Tax=Cylicocyclus nassatus TaxID=53992 RepID=A0AA36HC30_CYLNA|nr:unnamed protein product [Cylicocyclus nassatus]
MRVLLTLLLFSIFAFSTCNEEEQVYCDEMCPYFKKLHPDEKISYKEIKKECKKGIKEIEKSCAALLKLDKKEVKEGKKVYEKLTWNQACSKFCKV